MTPGTQVIIDVEVAETLTKQGRYVTSWVTHDTMGKQGTVVSSQAGQSLVQLDENRFAVVSDGDLDLVVEEEV